MKIPFLRKKIIINILALGILLLIFSVIILYNFNQKDQINQKVNKIKSETQQVKTQTIQLQSKLSEAKKYKELWGKITENKKSISGIKMDDINTNLEKIAAKNNIFKPAIKVTVPEILTGGIFDRSSFNVSVASANLTFESLNDVNALLFINDFFSSLPGYAVITNLDLKKARKYEDKDFVIITSGKPFGVVSVVIDFFWYTFKGKDVAPEKNKIEKGGANAPA